MTEETLEEYIKQYIKSQPGLLVNFGWQREEREIVKVKLERIIDINS